MIIDAKHKFGYIYKIYCKDTDVNEFYIGSSNDLHKRMIQHKSSYNKYIKTNDGAYLYKFIKNNGGWDNWEFDIIQQLTNGKYKLKDIEAEYCMIFKPSLNTKKPYINLTTKEYMKKYRQVKIKCECGEIIKETSKHRHLKSDRHKDNLKYLLLNDEEKTKIDDIKVKIKNKETISCDCGGVYKHVHKATHLKTDRHNYYMLNNISKKNNKIKLNQEKKLIKKNHKLMQEELIKKVKQLKHDKKEREKIEHKKNKKIEYELRKKNEKTFCECGGRYTYIKKKYHLQSDKHQLYLQIISS
tara:strand:+ start:75 stop:971 length:897 start_codon:yes stop_codon:yes gene_type:complete